MATQAVWAPPLALRSHGDDGMVAGGRLGTGETLCDWGASALLEPAVTVQCGRCGAREDTARAQQHCPPWAAQADSWGLKDDTFPSPWWQRADFELACLPASTGEGRVWPAKEQGHADGGCPPVPSTPSQIQPVSHVIKKNTV